MCKRKNDNLCLPLLNDKLIKDHFISECKGKTQCDITKFDDLMGKTIALDKIYK